MTVRMRHTPSHTRNRRSHHALLASSFVACSRCGTKILPHVVCKNCGYWRGKEAVDVLKKLSKKERKTKEKELAEQKEIKS